MKSILSFVLLFGFSQTANAKLASSKNPATSKLVFELYEKDIQPLKVTKYSLSSKDGVSYELKKVVAGKTTIKKLNKPEAMVMASQITTLALKSHTEGAGEVTGCPNAFVIKDHLAKLEGKICGLDFIMLKEANVRLAELRRTIR